jgi:glycosyltransferase involved in cell wall biosynthesis
MMKVVHVIPSIAARHGGPSKVVLELCKELATQGHQVSIYTTDIDGKRRINLDEIERLTNYYGIQIFCFKRVGRGLYGVSFDLANALGKAIHTFDIVHIHSLYRFSSTLAARYARRHNIPYLVTPHGTLDPFLFSRHRLRKCLYEWLLERRTLGYAAAVHFTAQEELRLAAMSIRGLRGVVVPLGADAAPTREESRPLETIWSLWPETTGKMIVLFLGRLNFKKGLDLLAKGFGNVARKRADVHLLLAGPDDEGYGRRVREWLRAEGVLEKSTFTGMLSGSAKAAALSGADVFVLPSYSENFGIAIVEAMAAGLPVIISDRVNIWREVASAGAGIIVRCNSEELAAALTLALDNPALLHSMSAAGRQLSAECFTWPIAARKMIEIYQSISASDPIPRNGGANNGFEVLAS